MVVARFWLMLCVLIPVSGIAETAELQLLHQGIGSEDRELSGLTGNKGQIFTVDDGDHRIFRIIHSKKNRFRFKPFLNLKKTKGYKEYKISAKAIADKKKLGEWLDLEGVSFCPKTGWFLVNERLRDIIRVTVDDELMVLNWDQSTVPQLMQGGANAGIEAIAVDCERNVIWVAKERNPRFIIGVNADTGKVIRTIALSGSDRSGQRVIDYRSGHGLMDIPDDIAGLAYDRDHLYVLERNTYEVAKYSLALGRVISRMSYYMAASKLYEQTEPYGLAEGLWLDKEQIFIGFDHNGGLLSASTSRESGVLGAYPVLLKFKRPTDF